ncbi:MAG TPA: META domain-containing protein [Ilumatobacteraceae bacterium]|nr:META domain-containing protein [Ilumatobacteraceae bacterium]
MIPRTALALSALALSALALAACGSDDDSPAADDSLPAVGSAPTADDLVDRSFESTEVTGHELVADSVIGLAFTADSVAARAGCNSMNGGYEIVDGTLEVGVMAATMMACDDALMDQDTWLSEFLTSGPQIALDGDTLTLTGADATMTLSAVQPAELEGPTWNVTGIVANEAVSSLPMDAEASITITDGQAAIRTGCNNGSTSVEITDTTITFGPIALTKMACPPELTELEASVLAVLDGEVTYEIAGDSLSVRNADGDVGLELTAG